MSKSSFKKFVSKILLISLFICFNQPLIQAYSQNSQNINYTDLIKQLEKINSISDAYISKKIDKNSCINEMIKNHLLLEKNLSLFLEQDNLKNIKNFISYLEKNPQLTIHLLTLENENILNEYSNNIVMTNLEDSLKIKKIINSKTQELNSYNKKIPHLGCSILGIILISEMIIGAFIVSRFEENHVAPDGTTHTTETVHQTPLQECGNCETLGKVICPSCDGFECPKCDYTGRIECQRCNGTGFLGIK